MYNPVKLFKKNPIYVNIDDSIYVELENNKLYIISNILKVIKKPKFTTYMTKIGYIKENTFHVLETSPNLTIWQFYRFIVFCMNTEKKPRYETFGNFLVSKNIATKINKNNNHVFPQCRFSPSSLCLLTEKICVNDSSRFELTPFGMNFILTNNEIGFKDFIEKYY